MTDDEDTKMAERWNKDAEGILIFTGLFSAAVAALVTLTIPDLKQNPQDESNFYLKNIYQILGDSNVSHPLIPFTRAEPPEFSPPKVPKYVIWVNSLWFLSLVISLTCAMLATSIQQWARRYIKVTQLPRYHDSPHDQARVREYSNINQLCDHSEHRRHRQHWVSAHGILLL
ncbi:hypothetical protein BJV78DRAFT_1122519 [Lactifluus subvellereus]|nr:hypothetical protein BJV78DRAFT_1122519 [Lactifluus subvellereus]